MMRIENALSTYLLLFWEMVAEATQIQLTRMLIAISLGVPIIGYRHRYSRFKRSALENGNPDRKAER